MIAAINNNLVRQPVFRLFVVAIKRGMKMKKTTIYMSLIALIFAASSCTKGCKNEPKVEEPAQEAPAEEVKEEAKEEAPAEPEKHEEAPGHEHAGEDKPEE